MSKRQVRDYVVLAVALALAAGTAAAQDARGQRSAAAFQAILDCRAQADSAARLACYDAAAAKMGEAATRGDIVVIDRSQAAAAHKEAFGLPLPSLDFIIPALKPDEVDSMSSVVASWRKDANGYATVVLEDGAVWRQIGGVLTLPPRVGSKVTIRRGALGSFLMKVDGQSAVKAHRDR